MLSYTVNDTDTQDEFKFNYNLNKFGDIAAQITFSCTTTTVDIFIRISEQFIHFSNKV